MAVWLQKVLKTETSSLLFCQPEGVLLVLIVLDGDQTITCAFQQQDEANTNSFLKKIPESCHRNFYFNLLG